MPDFNKLHLQAAVLFGTLLLFLIASFLFPEGPLAILAPLLGFIIVIEIFVFVGLEVKGGAQKHGWKHEVVDTLIALAVAVAIWYGASFILNTSSPISGVVSCSMLPNLHRGDFVIVHGAPIAAYEIEMSETELQSLNDAARITYGGNEATIPGSLIALCSASDNIDVCDAFDGDPEAFVERKGVFTYRYERCPITFTNGTSGYIPCLSSVEFKGQEYLTNFSHDTIVYQPPSSDYYALIGDIVHRALFKIDVDGKKYYVTRGDNNPLLDIQAYDYGHGLQNRPVPEEYVRGKVIFRIPLLGYFKLFISGYFQESPQCRTQLEFTHV